jgi:hypothetical protein
MKTQPYSLWILRIAASSRLCIAREEVAQAVGYGAPGPSLDRRAVNATTGQGGSIRPSDRQKSPLAVVRSWGLFPNMQSLS